jgi:hypothetical protein
MGKINLSSIKSCIESANDTFHQITEDKPFEMRIVNCGSPDSVDGMLQKANEMIKNIPSFTQTGS